VDPYLQAELQPELQPDEHVLWAGRPNPDRLFSGADIFLIPFSLLWGGFAIFWETLAITAIARAGSPAAFFPVFGLPFVAIGLYLIFGRFVVKRYMKRRTVYAVTDRRIIAIVTGLRRTVRSLSIKRLPGLEVSTGSGRAGSVTFGQWHGLAGMYANTGMDWMVWTMGQRRMAFYDLDDARTVYELVDRLAA